MASFHAEAEAHADEESADTESQQVNKQHLMHASTSTVNISTLACKRVYVALLALMLTSTQQPSSIHYVQPVQAEELLIRLVCLIRTMAEEGQGAIASALQAAARHLHDQGILVHVTMFPCN